MVDAIVVIVGLLWCLTVWGKVPTDKHGDPTR